MLRRNYVNVQFYYYLRNSVISPKDVRLIVISHLYFKFYTFKFNLNENLLLKNIVTIKNNLHNYEYFIEN